MPIASAMQIEQCLSLGVDPVQILEDHDQGLVEALAQQDALDGFQGAAPARLCVHLDRIAGRLLDSKEREEQRQCVLQYAIEREDLAGYLFAALTRVILGLDLEVVVEQFDHRQIGRRLAVRDGECFQHQASALRSRLEFMKQPRLAEPRLADRGDDLPAPLLDQLQRAAHRVHLAPAPDELRRARVRRNAAAGS